MDRNQLRRQVAHMRSSLIEQHYLDQQQFVQLEDLEDDSNPNFVEEIVTLFYKDSSRLFQKIDQALHSVPMDFARLDDYVHQFKGSSSSIGAIKVKNECTQFKEFCLAGNAEGCLRAFQRVKHEHEALKRQLETYFQVLLKSMGQLYNLDELHVTEEMPVRANKRSCGVASEDKKLELRLGPPGDQEQSVHSQLGFISSNPEAKRVCHELQVKAKNEETKWLANTAQHQPKSSYFQYPMIPHPDKKACSDPATASKFPISAAANGSDEKSKSRIAQAPVVGWPPVRSFRKNLANKSLAKAASDQSPLETLQEESKGKSAESSTKEHMFVKINMEGVPIGRKVNLKAYDSYEKLSSAIDHLFQGLLAAQRDHSAVEKENKEETKAISDSYTLLYEDNEGDRMLVGDVPWNMFVSTAKRLRVLKSSELSTLRLSSSRHEKTPLESAMEIGR